MREWGRMPRFVAICTLGWLAGVLLGCPPERERVSYYVAHSGDDAREGRSAAEPLATLQEALLRARAGDTIQLLPGVYYQDARSVRNGGAAAPIRVVGVAGPDGTPPVLRGAGAGRVFEIRHSHLWLEGFAIDGLFADPDVPEGYREKLIYVTGQPDGTGPRGVRLLNLTLRNAGTECLRFRYGAYQNEVGHSRIENCGVWDFRFDRGQRNGEGIYLGSAPEQLPTQYPRLRDATRDNWIHDNIVRTEGAECIDVKEGATQNLIERNDCSRQQDSKTGGISLRGPQNVVRANYVHDNLGAGIRIGGDRTSDALGNEIVFNELSNNSHSALKIMAGEQGRICGNRVGPHEYIVRGTGAAGVVPDADC